MAAPVSGLTASDRLRFGVVVGPWLLFALCAAALRGPATARMLRNRWITTLGGMCYSIYLLHYPMLILL
jgi:peptidoglycan/LPS O-acetylase OafA/YrhL